MSYVVRPDGTIECGSLEEALAVSRRLRERTHLAPAAKPAEEAASRPARRQSAPAAHPPALEPETRTCVRCKRTFALEPDEPRGRNVRRTCLELDCCRGPAAEPPKPKRPPLVFAVPSNDDRPLGDGTMARPKEEVPNG